eukprot:84422_1
MRLSCHCSAGILSFSVGKPVILPIGKISCGTSTVAGAAQIAATIRPERWNCLTVSTSRVLSRKHSAPLMPPVRTQLLGKATAIHNRRHRTLLAVDLITANTGVAVTTATRRPANPDTLTDLQTFILRGAPECHHAPNHLMPGNQRI